MNIPLYGQRDARWANQPINGTKSLIGPYGCTISCIGMVSGRNPGEEETYLRSIGAFTNDLVNWPKIPGFLQRFYCVDTPAPLDAIKAEIRAGRPVLLNVDAHPNDGMVRGDHWVLAVDENLTIHDPWYNDKVNVSPRYGKTPSVAILGGTYFVPQTDLNPSQPTMTFGEEFNDRFLKIEETQADGSEMVYQVAGIKSMETLTEIGDSMENVRHIPNWAGDSNESVKPSRLWALSEGYRQTAETLQETVDTQADQISKLYTAEDLHAAHDSGFKEGVASVPVTGPDYPPQKTLWELIIDLFKPKK